MSMSRDIGGPTRQSDHTNGGESCGEDSAAGGRSFSMTRQFPLER